MGPRKAGWLRKNKNLEQAALENKVSILTGGPGTGKQQFLGIGLHSQAKKTKVFLTALQVAQSVAESTGHFAQTVHRLLKFEPSR